MHVSPAKHSYASVTDGRTDDGQSDPYVSLCFAGDTKTISTSFGHNYAEFYDKHILLIVVCIVQNLG